MPTMPELVFCSQSTSPVFASKARKFRSLVPPARTRSPAVTVTEPNSCDLGKLCDQTFFPVAGSHAPRGERQAKKASPRLARVQYVLRFHAGSIDGCCGARIGFRHLR